MTLPEAIQARIDGIHMIAAVPMGEPTSLLFQGIASRPTDANVFTVETYADFPLVLDGVISAMCDGKSVTDISSI